jgi:hypothetical protein
VSSLIVETVAVDGQGFLTARHAVVLVLLLCLLVLRDAADRRSGGSLEILARGTSIAMLPVGLASAWVAFNLIVTLFSH